MLETIKTYLTQYGWQYKCHDDIIVTGFEAENGLFVVVIQYITPWLRISVPAYTPPLPTTFTSMLLYKLLELNTSGRMARFGIDERQSVTVCIDLFTEPELPYTQLETALDVISYVAETAHPHIMALINEGTT